MQSGTDKTELMFIVACSVEFSTAVNSGCVSDAGSKVNFLHFRVLGGLIFHVVMCVKQLCKVFIILLGVIISC